MAKMYLYNELVGYCYVLSDNGHVCNLLELETNYEHIVKKSALGNLFTVNVACSPDLLRDDINVHNRKDNREEISRFWRLNEVDADYVEDDSYFKSKLEDSSKEQSQAKVEDVEEVEVEVINPSFEDNKNSNSQNKSFSGEKDFDFKDIFSSVGGAIRDGVKETANEIEQTFKEFGNYFKRK